MCIYIHTLATSIIYSFFSSHLLGSPSLSQWPQQPNNPLFSNGHSNPAKKKKMTNIQPPTQHHPTITTATHFKPSQTKIKLNPPKNPTHNQQKPKEKLILNPNH